VPPVIICPLLKIAENFQLSGKAGDSRNRHGSPVLRPFLRGDVWKSLKKERNLVADGM
jgi:hypothetical protein